MNLFLLLYFVIYGGMNAIWVWKLRQAFMPGVPLLLASSGWALLMVISPFFLRVILGMGWLGIARATATLAFTWMGIAFCFFSATLVIDGIRVIRGLGHLSGIVAASTPYTPILFWASVGYCLLVVLTGWQEAGNLQIPQISLVHPRAPHTLKPLRIAQVSDLHLGLTSIPSRIDRVLTELASVQADLIFFTGDLIDGPSSIAGEVAQKLNAIQPPGGKFAVMGNHEFFHGVEESKAFFEKCGIILLRQGVASPLPGVSVAGVDDPMGGSIESPPQPEEKALLEALASSTFRILLKHRPDVGSGSQGLFDLQLSGHTHNGQIAPFFLLTNLFSQFPCGLHQLSPTSWLYHSRGTATWGPPIRFFSPPELTVFEIAPPAGS